MVSLMQQYCKPSKMARVHLYVVLLCVLRLYWNLGAFSPGIILSLDPFKSNFEVYL